MAYQAKQGDIIWLSFDPQAGHEQKGRRPAIVTSNDRFNRHMRTTAMICPITSTNRSEIVHIRLHDEMETHGYILCDQAKILDLQARNAEFIERAPDDIIFEMVDIISSFLEIER